MSAQKLRSFHHFPNVISDIYIYGGSSIDVHIVPSANNAAFHVQKHIPFSVHYANRSCCVWFVKAFTCWRTRCIIYLDRSDETRELKSPPHSFGWNALDDTLPSDREAGNANTRILYYV